MNMHTSALKTATQAAGSEPMTRAVTVSGKVGAFDAEGAPVMRLMNLPVNGAWAFLFGSALIRLHVADKTLYPTRAEAVADARLCRLAVTSSGNVNCAE